MTHTYREHLMPSWEIFVQRFRLEETIAVLITVICIVLANGGFSLRRWWKRKGNADD